MQLFCIRVQNPTKKPAKKLLFTKITSWKTEIFLRELVYNLFSRFQSRITFCRTPVFIDENTSRWLLNLFVHSKKSSLCVYVMYIFGNKLSCVINRYIYIRNICGNCPFTENFVTRKLGGKACIYSCVTGKTTPNLRKNYHPFPFFNILLHLTNFLFAA